MCRQLLFSSSDDDNTLGTTPSTPRVTLASSQVNLEDNKEEEDDFQMVPLNDDHWTSEENPIEHCVYMNMANHMSYAHIHALM